MNFSRLSLVTCAASLPLSLSLLLSGCGSGGETAGTPAISGQPASQVIATGSNAVLSVVATGASLAYQWYQDGAAIRDATGALYTATKAGTYYVVVTNAIGSVTSADAVVTVTSAPVVTAHPASATILAGTSQVLQVAATGAGLAYQWYRDGSAIAGATAASYEATAAGSYTVTVTNAAGSSTSAAAIVSITAVAAIPDIVTQPAALTVNAGTPATFKVVATGVNLTYQWYRDGEAIPGATAASYTVATATASHAGVYKVIVTNPAGAIASSTAALTVNLVGVGTNTAAVVNAANAFMATLSTDQKALATSSTASSTVLFSHELANASQWTNLPGDRHGLRLNTSTLTAAQLAAANAVIASSLSATGIALMGELRAADEVLAAAPGTGMGGGTPPGDIGTPLADGTGMPPPGTMPGMGGTGGTGGMAGMGYGAGMYSIAFVGTPSTSTPWMLQLTGHHLAYNITYNGTKVSATPNFIGVEPPNWRVAADGTVAVNGSASAAGTAYAPLERQRAAMYRLAESIYADSSSANAAKLAGTFTDVLMGASGNSDASYKTLAYPTTARGLAYTAMNATQKAHVRAAIEAWVGNQAADVAAALLAAYLDAAALDATYVGYGVGQNGSKADFGAYPNAVAAPLDAQRSYIRIDGPRVWIEFIVQQGVVYPNYIHYHTLWRDKTADYGGVL